MSSKLRSEARPGCDSVTDGAGSGWSVSSDGWCPEAVVTNGNRFLLGNGYMGYRGTLEEFGSDQQVGILLAGLYDQVGDAWREPVNAPNGLFTQVSVDGKPMNALNRKPVGHCQELDLFRAIHSRQTAFEPGLRVELASERFLSAANVHLMAMRYTVRLSEGGEILIESGFDPRIWDLNGPHLEGLDFQVSKEGILTASAVTSEQGIPVCAAECAIVGGTGRLVAEETTVPLRRWTLQLDEPGEVVLCKYVAIFTGLDGAGDVRHAAIHAARSAMLVGYNELREQHCTVWKERWERADVKVEGDLESQLALRYSMFLLLSSAPFHSENLSIPARALSAQVYKGAVFWDTDIFMFPFFLSAFPEVARNLIAYRIHTLPGARKKAREYGFKGAFYPWEGQEGGHDACTLFNITDVFTGRPMRTYFRDKQIHISADVVWAVWQYAGVTGDASILWEGGFEVMLECARFFHSYAYRLSDESTFVLVDVTGPDEYHERVGNNAFTNYMVQEAVASTLKCATLLEEADPRRFAALREDLEFQPEEHARLREFAEHLVLPVADPDNGVIPQFDGYFSLEDCSLEALKSRVLDPNEYLGGGNGLATTTQILKQADVVLLMHLLPERFTREEKLVNWEYYEPRTEHGSSLSACAYALVAAAIGKPDFAYTYFLKTATIDLSGKSKQFVGTLYIGGTHPAANGGAWMVATQGFAGVRLLPDHVLLEPQLPRHWESLEFSCRWKGRTLHVTVSRDAFAVAADPANDGPVLLHFQGTSHACPPGASWSGPSL